MQWATLRGDAHVTNLQHNDIVLVLGCPTWWHGCILRLLGLVSDASSQVLGYDQPVVEDKPMGEEVADTEDEESGDEL